MHVYLLADSCVGWHDTNPVFWAVQLLKQTSVVTLFVNSKYSVRYWIFIVTWIAVLGGGGGNGDGDAAAATGDGCEYDKRYNTEGFIVET